MKKKTKGRKKANYPTLTKKELSEHVNLYDINRYFDGCHVLGKLDPILGNDETRILTVLLWGVSGIPILVRGESGSGKTKIGNAVIHLFFGDVGLRAGNPDVFLINESSDKAYLDHESEEFVKRAKRCYIPELQNVKNLEAMVKLWCEGRPKVYGRSKAGRETDKVVLEPLPILSNLADGNEEMRDLSNEMERRIVSLPTKSGEHLNKQVHQMKAKMRKKTKRQLETLSPEESDRLMFHLLGCMENTKGVLNPCSETIEEVVPHKYTRSNTFIGYFLDVVEAIAIFYQKERVIVDDEGDKYIIATPTDNYLAYLLAGDIFRDLAIGIPPLGKEVLNFLPVHEYAFGDIQAEDVREDRVHIDQIVDRLDDLGFPRPKKIVDDLMKKLVSAGYARVDKEGFYYRTKELENGFKLEPERLFEEAEEYMKNEWQELYEDYVGSRAYTHYINPISGEECTLVKERAEEKDNTELGAIVQKEEEKEILTVPAGRCPKCHLSRGTGPIVCECEPMQDFLPKSDEAIEIYELEFSADMLKPPTEFTAPKGKTLKRLRKK
jgi:hypothetical protein